MPKGVAVVDGAKLQVGEMLVYEPANMLALRFGSKSQLMDYYISNADAFSNSNSIYIIESVSSKSAYIDGNAYEYGIVIAQKLNGTTFAFEYFEQIPYIAFGTKIGNGAMLEKVLKASKKLHPDYSLEFEQGFRDIAKGAEEIGNGIYLFFRGLSM